MVSGKVNVPISYEEQTRMLAEKERECNASVFNSPQGYCERLFDGILCWPPTAPGVMATQKCPSYFKGFQEDRNATKECMGSGDWYINPQTNTTWTNYSQCTTGETVTVLVPFPVDNTNLTNMAKFVPTLKLISQIGYGVSLSTLVVAFLILACFKKLRCPRNSLHMHLFVSFIMRAALSLLKDTLFVKGVGLPSDLIYTKDGPSFIGEMSENWTCKLITSLWQYFILANYSWILMEGLYLHNLIFLALFSDTSAITSYVIFGWSLPLIFVVIWVIVRATLEDTLCWTTHTNSNYFLIIKIPIIVSIVVNFVLFINIVRVLLLKLTASISEENRRFRRWAKSTLVLVPLFGVHYALFIWMSYSIGVNEKVEIAWLFCDRFFGSLQGFFVAVLYCFLNGEVRAEMMKKWRKAGEYQYGFSQRSTPRIEPFMRRKGNKRASSTVESCMTSFMSSVPTELSRRTIPHTQYTDINPQTGLEMKQDTCLLPSASLDFNHYSETS